MTVITHGPLTTVQVQRFHEEGYLVLPAVFSLAEIASMAAEAERILALILNSSLAAGRRSPRLDVSQKEGRLDIRKVQPINDLSDLLRAVSEDERLVGPLRQLMGHEPVLMEEKLNYKQPVDCPAYVEALAPREGDDRFPLHHDWGYYRQQGYPTQILSSAISIDPSTPASGPIRVIPGTHRREFPLKDPSVAGGNGQVIEGLFEEDARVDILAPAGSVMLFHSMLLHDSYSNRSGAPRRIMIYSHYPASHSFPEDLRNSRGRRAGQELEAEYREKVARGEYVDQFRAGAAG